LQTGRIKPGVSGNPGLHEEAVIKNEVGGRKYISSTNIHSVLRHCWLRETFYELLRNVKSLTLTIPKGRKFEGLSPT